MSFGGITIANILDVAKFANVSVATVSRVLNNPEQVKESTRLAVLDAIEKTNYRPNLMGRNLRRSESKMVLVLLPTISNSFYSEVIKGMQEAAEEHGYHLMICTTGSSEETALTYIDLLHHRLADGAILLSPIFGTEDLGVLSKEFPLVQCCEINREAEAHYVTIDNEMAAFDAVKVLIENGHQKIALIGAGEFSNARERKKGYLRALSEASLPIVPEWMFEDGNYGFKSGQKHMKELIELPNQPTAIFAVADSLAIGATTVILDSGYKVPEHYAVMGFDDVLFSSQFRPRLSTVRQPQYEMGKQAFRVLYERFCDVNLPVQKVVLPHQVILRQSTRKQI